MLYKHIILVVALSTILWSAIIQHISAAIIASLKPVGFIVSAISDGVIEPQILLPNGVSEHAYSLRPSDIKRLQNAELIVWIGPEMEGFMKKSTKNLAPEKQVIISALDGVKSLMMKHTHDGEYHCDIAEGNKNSIHHYHGKYNMHLWLSPEIARISAIAIHTKLVTLMPQNRTKLDANLKDFKMQLSLIDKKVRIELAPLKSKGYFVFHDAYSYYEKHYGLTPIGYFTFNPEILPSVHRLHEIRVQLIKQKATCVFAEPQFRPAVVAAVTRGTTVRIGTLDPIGMNIQLSKESYIKLLAQLANQYTSCLKGD